MRQLCDSSTLTSTVDKDKDSQWARQGLNPIHGLKICLQTETWSKSIFFPCVFLSKKLWQYRPVNPKFSYLDKKGCFTSHATAVWRSREPCAAAQLVKRPPAACTPENEVICVISQRSALYRRDLRYIAEICVISQRSALYRRDQA